MGTTCRIVGRPGAMPYPHAVVWDLREFTPGRGGDSDGGHNAPDGTKNANSHARSYGDARAAIHREDDDALVCYNRRAARDTGIVSVKIGAIMRHGSQLDPPNRFERTHSEPDFDHLDWDREHLEGGREREIEYFADRSKSIVSENKSPDVPFRYSVNPYRGCVHACAYCYARPTHEYLGFNAGLDFETKIMVKHDAAQLFRDFLARESWQVEPITFSGVTDCFQPAERRFKLTRQCLGVALDHAQPVTIITKNALVLRDLDILRPMAESRLVQVLLSVTTLNEPLARDMEPRTSTPAARLRAVSTLADAGIPVGVLVAPIIPGLTDSELPAILEATSQAGAQSAGYVLLRLPLTVAPVFNEWLARTQPLKSDRVLGLIRETRAGSLNSSNWGERMVGRGAIADQIQNLFDVFRQKYRLDRKLPPLNVNAFKRPHSASGQLTLF